MPQPRHGHRHRPVHQSRPRRRLGLVAAVVAVLTLVGAGAYLLTRGGDDSSRETAAPAPANATTVTSYSGGPRLVVDRALYDEGDVPYEHEVSATFNLTNVGDAPLELGKATVNTLEGC